jgi:UbiD family decarboxylase
MPFKDLREFMAHLESRGDLARVKREVSNRFEIGAVIRKVCDMDGPAVLFENVNGFNIPVLSNLFGSYRRVASVFGIEVKNLHSLILEKIESYPLNPVVKPSGPVKYRIKTGEAVNIYEFPVPFWNEKDGGPFITWGIQIAREPGTGKINASVHRMQIHSKNTLGIFADPPQHLGWYRVMAEEQKRPLEMAVVIGCAPSIILSSIASVPYAWDELSLAGALQGEPIELVQCETIDVLVPASAEIVLEGEILPGITQLEGHFGEVTGYYDQRKVERPVFRIKAISHRKDPVFLGAYVGRPITENHIAHTFGKSPFLLKELKEISPRVLDAYFPPETFSQYALIKIKKSFSGASKEEPKRLAFATFAHFYSVKQCVVVDEDIDIYDNRSVQWAIATRVRPERDIHIIPNCMGTPLEVAYGNESERGIASKFILDATRKYPDFPKLAEPPRDLLDKVRLEEYLLRTP